MTMKTWCAVCLFLAAVVGLFLILPNRDSAHASEAAEANVQIAMKNVMYHYTGTSSNFREKSFRQNPETSRCLTTRIPLSSP